MNWVYGHDFGNAMFGMLAEISGDIILKTDNKGFIVRASPGLGQLGICAEELLIWPHVADLADKRFAAEVREFVGLALRGMPQHDCMEFPLARVTSRTDSAQLQTGARAAARWFALRMRPTPPSEDAPGGAMGMLRKVQKPHMHEARALDSGLIDPLTGLGNRRALAADIAQRMSTGRHEVLVLIEIDSFRSLSLRYGPSTGEEMICAFADFLLVMLGEDSCLSRLGGSRFAFLSGHKDPRLAREMIKGLLDTFARLSSETDHDGPAVTASAGLAAPGESPDLAIARAEKALILAGSAGRSRVEVAENLPHYLTREQRIA